MTRDPGETRAREDNILALVQAGNRMATIQLVRDYFGNSLGEPDKFVNELMGVRPNHDPSRPQG